MVDLFLELGRLADYLVHIEIAGQTYIFWWRLMWTLAIVGWALRIMYGQRMK